jgi:hypothetical protein
MVSIRHRERSGDPIAHPNQGVDRCAHIDDVLKSTRFQAERYYRRGTAGSPKPIQNLPKSLQRDSKPPG